MRITGGAHRSRVLVAPRGNATRPTSDRVREALFAILAADGLLSGARVLDLYAGTGALGLEALSRGADSLVAVESSKDALVALRANVHALGLDAAVRVLPMTVERAARALAPSSSARADETAPAPFDIVFADPPYADVTRGDAARALLAVVRAGAIREGARVVLEHGKGDAAPELPGLALADTRRYGDTCLSFYVQGAAAETGARNDASDAADTRSPRVDATFRRR